MVRNCLEKLKKTATSSLKVKMWGRLRVHLCTRPQHHGCTCEANFDGCAQGFEEEVEQRLTMLLADNDGRFACWKTAIFCGAKYRWPNWQRARQFGAWCCVIASDLLEPQARDRIQERLGTWLKAHLKNRLAPYFQLQAADLKGSPRGLAFH